MTFQEIDKIFDQVLACWDDNGGQLDGLFQDIISCVDHKKAREISEWVISNCEDMVYYRGSTIVLESWFKKRFHEMMKKL